MLEKASEILMCLYGRLGKMCTTAEGIQSFSIVFCPFHQISSPIEPSLK